MGGHLAFLLMLLPKSDLIERHRLGVFKPYSYIFKYSGIVMSLGSKLVLRLRGKGERNIEKEIFVEKGTFRTTNRIRKKNWARRQSNRLERPKTCAYWCEMGSIYKHNAGKNCFWKYVSVYLAHEQS